MKFQFVDLSRKPWHRNQETRELHVGFVFLNPEMMHIASPISVASHNFRKLRLKGKQIEYLAIFSVSDSFLSSWPGLQKQYLDFLQTGSKLENK